MAKLQSGDERFMLSKLIKRVKQFHNRLGPFEINVKFIPQDSNLPDVSLVTDRSHVL